MAKLLQLFGVVCLIFMAKFYFINCNEHLFTSAQNNVYYIEGEQKFSWYDALAKCASMNMSLVTIDTKMKSEDITVLLSNIFGRRMPLWIGGTVNSVNPRQFVWISTGTKFIYTNWSNGQPDFAGNNEYCAQTGWTNNMEWNDHVCSNAFGFMCEYSRYHQCEEELKRKWKEDEKKQQQIELKQFVGDVIHGLKDGGDGASKTFRDLIFNIHQK